MKMVDLPDERGHFGQYGGVFVAETLVHALDELRRAYERCRKDPEFIAEFEHELKHYVGRPTPVYHARRLSDRLGGAQIYIKREDLNHTGAHKINNTIGQALLARRMGKPRVIAETGAGMHGVAAATVAARFGIASGKHAASLCAGRPGVLHGNRTYLLQDEHGQILETHSISAGLDYPGVGPEHAWLKDTGRAQYVTVEDAEALAAFNDLCHYEGIIPALESAHALAYAAKLAPTLARDKILLVNLSGRGDKDMHTVAEKSGIRF